MIHAVDAYTGRILWKAALPDSPKGLRCVAAEDRVYVRLDGRVLVLDAETGEEKPGFKFPGFAGDLRVSGEALVVMAKGPVRQVGINFGAPGDRRTPDGTLWLDYPSVGGPSPNVPVRIVPDKPQAFRHHSLQIQGEELKWVAASGVEGLQSLTISLGNPGARPYTVRLHFAEPNDLRPGQRVFSVSVQGDQVLKDFDVAKEAGGPNMAIVKEFRGIQAADKLEVALGTVRGKTLICVMEVVAEAP